MFAHIKTAQMTRKSILLFASLIALAIACSKVSSTLDKAESLMTEAPDSALLLLDGIPKQELTRGGIYARYALLKSMALDKCYIDVDNDSLIRKALDYYENSVDKHYRMLANYYYGLVKKNAKEYTPSIVALEKAEALAEELQDYLYLGLICRNKASLFLRNNNNQAAIENRKKSIIAFEQTDRKDYTDYAKLLLAFDYLNAKQNESAIIVLEDLLSNVNEMNTSLVYQTRLCYADVLSVKGTEPHEAIELFRGIPNRYFTWSDYGHWASAWIQLGNIDSANFYLGLAKELSKGGLGFYSIAITRSDILIKEGKDGEAYRVIREALSVQDSVTRVQLAQSLNAAQRDYYKAEKEREAMIKESQKERFIWIIAIIILVFIIFLHLLSRRIREKDRRLKENMALLAAADDSVYYSSVGTKAIIVGDLLINQLLKLSFLSKEYFDALEEKSKDIAFRNFRETVNSLRSNESLLQSIESYLDKYCDGVMSKLSAQIPSIKKNKKLLITLFFADLSYEEIMLITNWQSVDSLMTMRSRLKKIISESGAPDTQLFLELLKHKKATDEWDKCEIFV